jgi:hypothetical protein
MGSPCWGVSAPHWVAPSCHFLGEYIFSNGCSPQGRISSPEGVAFREYAFPSGCSPLGNTDPDGGSPVGDVYYILFITILHPMGIRYWGAYIPHGGSPTGSIYSPKGAPLWGVYSPQ